MDFFTPSMIETVENNTESYCESGNANKNLNTSFYQKLWVKECETAETTVYGGWNFFPQIIM